MAGRPQGTPLPSLALTSQPSDNQVDGKSFYICSEIIIFLTCLTFVDSEVSDIVCVIGYEFLINVLVCTLSFVVI